jgi:hypothetical protein
VTVPFGLPEVLRREAGGFGQASINRFYVTRNGLGERQTRAYRLLIGCLSCGIE